MSKGSGANRKEMLLYKILHLKRQLKTFTPLLSKLYTGIPVLRNTFWQIDESEIETLYRL